MAKRIPIRSDEDNEPDDAPARRPRKSEPPVVAQMTVEDMQEAAARACEKYVVDKDGDDILSAREFRDVAALIRGIEIPRGRVDPSSRHALQVVIEMVELYAPSLINSGGFMAAKRIAGWPAERHCRVCGCTDNHACLPDPCYWVDVDLCSSCVGDAEARASLALREIAGDRLPQFLAEFIASISAAGAAALEQLQAAEGSEP